MKSSKIILAILFLFASLQICFAQAKNEPVLVDEFGNIACDEFLARLDNYFVELQNEPASVGYAVIYAQKNNLLKNFKYELWINGHIKWRRFDKSRLNILRGEERENFKIQFWKVPAGIEKPKILEATWDLTLPTSTKPFIFYDYSFDILCPSANYEKAYSEILVANPNFRGNLVIHEKTVNQFNRTKKAILNKLTGFSQNRLRFFFVKSKDSYVEYWLVPPKRK